MVVPPPASVVTAPDATSTTRTRWLALSATYSAAPAGAMARPYGALKPAAVPKLLT